MCKDVFYIMILFQELGKFFYYNERKIFFLTIELIFEGYWNNGFGWISIFKIETYYVGSFETNVEIRDDLID